MCGDSDAPAHEHPWEPECARGEPEIDGGTDDDARRKGGEMGEEDAHGEVVEHMTRLSEMTGFVRNDRFRKKIPKI